MDDILSAALGQSGLNFSFLEDQEEQGGDNGATTNQHASTKTAPGNIVNKTGTGNLFKDDTEDVTELLNLLDDSESTHGGNTDTKFGGKNNDMLDLLLKISDNDDEDEAIVNSPTLSPASFITTPLENSHNQSKNVKVVTTNLLETKKLISITSKLPKINSSPTLLNIKNLNKTSNKVTVQSSSIVKRLTNVPSVIGNNKSTDSSNEIKNQTVVKPNLTKQIIVKTSTGAAKIKVNSSSIASTMNDNKTKLLSKTLTEEEKKKLSIQHVLASPNLTFREKQFLMKKALSANIKPSHPALSSTVK